MTIPTLIHEANKGSSAAQQNLFERLSPWSKMLCLRYVRNNEDAEEVMLDGFYKFFKSLHAFRYTNEQALFSYIKTIMVNECLYHLRKTSSFNLIGDGEIPDVPDQGSILNNLQWTDIYEMIVQLPPGYRTVFNLFCIEGYDHKEIATALKIAESSSRSQLVRARMMLQKMLTTKIKNYDRQDSK